MTGKKTITQNRSAITGRFVTSAYVKTHKSTTVTEHVVRKPPKSRGK